MNDSNDTKKFAANTAWLMIQRIYTMLLSLVVGALTARYLGPANKGLLDYGAALINIFAAASQLGLGGVLVAELIRKPEKKGGYMGAALLLRLVSSVVSIACVMLIIRIMAPGNALLQRITFFQSISILFQTYEMLNYYFQSEMRSKYYVFAVMLGATAAGAWRIFLLATGKSIEWFAFSTSVNSFVILVFCVAVFARVFHARVSVRWEDVRFLLSNSYHFLISQIASVLYLQIDRLMLGEMLGETAVGYYSSAASVAELWEFVPLALISSAAPILYRLRDTDEAEYRRKMQWLFAGVSLMGIAVALAFSALAGPIIKLLYGEAFRPSTPLLRILIWSTGVAVINCVRTTWLVAERLNRYAKYFVGVGTLCNVALNALLIPKIGASGAAIATLITQTLVFLMSAFFAETRAVNRLYLSSFGELGGLAAFVCAYVRGVWKGRVHHEH